MMCAIFKHSLKDKKSDFSEKIFQKNRIQPITRYLISSGKSRKPIFAMYFCQTLESRNKCLLLGKALKVRLVAVWRLYKLLPVSSVGAQKETHGHQIECVQKMLSRVHERY